MSHLLVLNICLFLPFKTFTKYWASVLKFISATVATSHIRRPVSTVNGNREAFLRIRCMFGHCTAALLSPSADFASTSNG
ncbi:hypothetical protein B0H19DRAFT_19615 [Mycena capillaripes]|nr:hypothetical protein B0H19DRAFT_19615 [Mycena capillaripes]